MAAGARLGVWGTMARHEVTPVLYGLRTGVIFGLLMGTYRFIEDHDVRAALIGGVFAGTFFGLFMSIWAVRQRRRVAAALGSATPTADRRALKRAIREPESVGPEVRSEALRLHEYQLIEFSRTRRRSILVFAILLVLELVMALTSSPWFWLGVVVFTGFLILTLVSGSRLRRTVDRLRG